MKAAPYSLATLREYRRRNEQRKVASAPALKDLPPDAPMEEGIVIGCWNGEAFVSWEKWLASQPAEAFGVSPEGQHG
jgi:hypothetical protein